MIKKIPKERYISPEERQKFTDDLRLIKWYNNGISKSNDSVRNIHGTNYLEEKTKNWIEVNNESRGTYNEDDQIRFKISMLRSSLCDYRDSDILLNEL